MQIEEFKLENWINLHAETTKYDLTDTCVEALSLKELAKITNCDFNEILLKKLNYGELKGSKRLKTAISNLYEHQNSENITVTLGGIGANQLAIETLVNKGDKVVCILPCYQQAYALPKFYGANVQLFYLNSSDWSLDVKKFKQVVGNNTKLICFTSPNNPTGLKIKEIDEIIDVADSIGAYILADEVYRGLKYSGNSYVESVVDKYKKAISTGSMSKAYSLAGIRLGWIVSEDKDLIEKINHNREYNTISVSALDDYIACIALENHKLLIERNLNRLKIGRQIVSDWIKRHKNVLSWVESDCGTTGFVKYNFDVNSTEFAQKLFDDTGILIIPASMFDMDKNYFRIGFGMNQEYLKNALNEFSKWLKRTYL